MKYPTTKIEKSKIALVQLRRSIQLYYRGDFISSVTLAGAANEILGQLALKRKGSNTLDHDKWFWDGMSEILNKSKPSKHKIKHGNNRVKNNLKHHDVAEDTTLEADFEFEASSQINSAIRNYWIAFGEPAKDRIISRYVKNEWT